MYRKLNSFVYRKGFNEENARNELDGVEKKNIKSIRLNKTKLNKIVTKKVLVKKEAINVNINADEDDTTQNSQASQSADGVLDTKKVGSLKHDTTLKKMPKNEKFTLRNPNSKAVNEDKLYLQAASKRPRKSIDFTKDNNLFITKTNMLKELETGEYINSNKMNPEIIEQNEIEEATLEAELMAEEATENEHSTNLNNSELKDAIPSQHTSNTTESFKESEPTLDVSDTSLNNENPRGQLTESGNKVKKKSFLQNLLSKN